MVFLSIFAERFHQSLRDWKESALCVVVFCILLLLLLDRSGLLSRASSRNEEVFPNENLELIIIIEVEEKEGTTLREERCRRRLLEKEEEGVAEVVA